jgi:hypothetical protein
VAKGKARQAKQRRRAGHTKRREANQLAGRTETRPGGAAQNEVAQSSWEPALPDLVLRAAREDWSTPGPAKRRAILALLEPVYCRDVVLDKDGNQVIVQPNRELIRKNIEALHTLDQTQWERDHPEEAGKLKGGVNINNQNVQQAVNMEAVLGGEWGALEDGEADGLHGEGGGLQPRAIPTPAADGTSEPDERPAANEVALEDAQDRG